MTHRWNPSRVDPLFVHQRDNPGPFEQVNALLKSGNNSLSRSCIIYSMFDTRTYPQLWGYHGILQLERSSLLLSSINACKSLVLHQSMVVAIKLV